MATITLTPPGGGQPVSVTVGDNFAKLSPAAQQQTVEEISAQAFPNLTAADQPAQPVSTNPLDALRNAAGSIVSGVGKAGQTLDQAIQANFSPGWAKALGATRDLVPGGLDQATQNAGQAISGPNQYQSSPIHALGSDIASGHPLDALNDAAGAVAGALPYAATAAIPVVGPAILGAAGAGNTLASREAAQGTSSPSLGDVAAATGSGLLNAVGGGIAHGGTSSVLRAALGPVADRIAARVALSGAAGGALGAANNVLNTAGTGQLTPGGVANAAIEGAGQGALSAPAAALGGKLVPNAAKNVGAPPPTPTTSDLSNARVGQMVQQRMAQIANVRGSAPSPLDAVNSLAQEIKGHIADSARLLKDRGLITPSDANTVFGPLVSQAMSHKNGIGETDDDPTAAATAFDRLKSLNLPAAISGPIQQGLIDLDTISQNKLKNQSSGPFHRVGGVLGKVVGGALPDALGLRIPGAGLSEDLLGFNLGGQIGGGLGSKVDNALGLNTPPVVAKAKAAQKLINRNNMNAGPNTLQALQDLNAQLQPPPDASPVGLSQAQIHAANISALTKYGPDHPVGQAAQSTLQAAGLSQQVQDAITKFNANQPVAQAKADVRNQGAADAKNEADAQRRRRADAAAALGQLAMATGKADNLAARNQVTLDAANITPQGGPGVGLTAVNAAANQLGRQAKAVRAAGGEVVPADGEDDEAPTSAPTTSAPTPAQAPPSAATTSPAAPQGSPRDFMSHLILRAGDEHGINLTPDDIHGAITQATANGALTPDDYERINSKLGQNLQSGEEYHTANLILQHAAAAKAAAGAPVRGVGPRSAGVDTPPIYSPTRYANTVHTNQAHLDAVAAQAYASGDQQLGDLASSLKTMKKVSERRIARDGLANLRLQSGDITGAVRVKGLLNDDLINAGDKS